MADDQADASGKYGMDGREPRGAAKYWPTIVKSIELVSRKFLFFPFYFKAMKSHSYCKFAYAFAFATKTNYLFI